MRPIAQYKCNPSAFVMDKPTEAPMPPRNAVRPRQRETTRTHAMLDESPPLPFESGP
jgi:hypothetical protein